MLELARLAVVMLALAGWVTVFSWIMCQAAGPAEEEE
jgi:hypothetical protein